MFGGYVGRLQCRGGWGVESLESWVQWVPERKLEKEVLQILTALNRTQLSPNLISQGFHSKIYVPRIRPPFPVGS